MVLHSPLTASPSITHTLEVNLKQTRLRADFASSNLKKSDMLGPAGSVFGLGSGDADVISPIGTRGKQRLMGLHLSMVNGEITMGEYSLAKRQLLGEWCGY